MDKAQSRKLSVKKVNIKSKAFHRITGLLIKEITINFLVKNSGLWLIFQCTFRQHFWHNLTNNTLHNIHSSVPITIQLSETQ